MTHQVRKGLPQSLPIWVHARTYGGKREVTPAGYPLTLCAQLCIRLHTHVHAHTNNK